MKILAGYHWGATAMPSDEVVYRMSEAVAEVRRITRSLDRFKVHVDWPLGGGDVSIRDTVTEVYMELTLEQAVDLTAKLQWAVYECQRMITELEEFSKTENNQ